MTRSFFIDASLPASFWLNVVYVAIYTINRLPTPVVNEKSPYEVLFVKVSYYSFLKPFMCACFPHFVTTSTKLPSRFFQCVFLGYAPHYKGYHCLDPCINRVYISHDVRFHENIFPYSTLASKALSLLQAPPFVL